MIASFVLTLRSAVRGRFLPSLAVLTLLVFRFAPSLIRTDGTDAGFREMYVRAVPGTVFALALVAFLVYAAGATASERESFRLAQSAVRPASAFSVLAGQFLALASGAFCILAFAAVLTLALNDFARVPCFRHVAPSLPPPQVCARAALDAFLANPETPEAVRKAPRRTVLSLLAAKEMERYDVVRAGERMEWPFDPAAVPEDGGLSVRVRFATQFDLRVALAGTFAFGGLSGTVSNNTQAVLDVPLAGERTAGADSLTFENRGASAVMLRPRRDIEILAPADDFAANIARAAAGMLAVVAAFTALGIFLSSALSRPVAVFSALVLLAVVMMAPDVAERFADDLDASLADRIGVAVSRVVHSLTSSVSGFSPVSSLATGRAIGWGELLRVWLVDALAIPALLLSAAAFVCRRKPLP